MAGAKPWKRSLQAATFVALVALFVSLFDPMGLDEASDRRSVQAVDRVLALYYAPQAVGRELLTTVAVSETSLNAVGRDWPPQYGFYAEVVKTLTASPQTMPSALFVDYTFLTDLHDPAQRDEFVNAISRVTRAEQWASDRNCVTDPLARITCIRKAGGTPVIVGKPYPTDRCEATPTLVMLDRVALLAPIGWPGFEESWAPVITKGQYQTNAQPGSCQAIEGIRGPDGRPSPMDLPIAIDGGGERSPTGAHRLVTHRYAGVAGYDLTPAGAMLVSLCTDPRAAVTKPAICSTLFKADDLILPEAWTQLNAARLIWGSRPDPHWLTREKEIYQAPEDVRRLEACDKENAKGGAKFFRATAIAIEVFFSRLGEGGASAALGCPYHADFGYERLVPGAVGQDPGPIFRDFIAGRVVIVGSSIRYGGDWIETVTRGPAPGMASHAMMFDNLVEDRWVSRPPPPILTWKAMDLDLGELLEVCVAFLTALAIKRTDLWTELPERKGKAYRKKLANRWIAFLLLLLVAVPAFIILATVIVRAWNWTPANIQALFALMIIQVMAEFRDVWPGLASQLARAPRKPRQPRSQAQ